MAGFGEPAFRAGQLSRHYFARLTRDPADMTDLPAQARERLAEALLPGLLTAERELSCDGGTTRKTLWRTFDGALVESVLMRYPDRVTMCVSSPITWGATWRGFRPSASGKSPGTKSFLPVLPGISPIWTYSSFSRRSPLRGDPGPTSSTPISTRGRLSDSCSGNSCTSPCSLTAKGA